MLQNVLYLCEKTNLENICWNISSSTKFLFLKSEINLNLKFSFTLIIFKGFVMPSCLANAGPLEVEFGFLQKTDIFIHHNGQFLSPNSRSRVNVDVNNYIKIAGIITYEIKYLYLFGELC